MPEVQIYPHPARPGVGLKPRRESQRPFLPQHARHCPVLEAGSALGYLVYPPLEPNESFHVAFQGDGLYQLTYFVTTPRGQETIFSLAVQLSAGSLGTMKQEITFMNEKLPLSPETVMCLARTLTVPENLGTPNGGISLRGATSFQTPQGWDTVYMPVLNAIERPYA